MSDESDLALRRIQVSGDILEQKFFADEEFAKSFDLYPLIWKRHVLPLRKPNSFQLDTDHLHAEFAARHYTTIVRCWMAYTANKDIASHCEAACAEPSVENQLRLHRLLFEFYCSLGAAIDNMEYCYASHPISCVDEFTSIRKNTTKLHPDTLDWLYDRRTQFIHHTLVPCFYEKDLLHLNEGILENKQGEWDDQTPGKNAEISDLCNSHWRLFVGEMKTCWSKLLRLFTAKVGRVEICLPPDTVMSSTTACSGTPPDLSPPASGHNWMAATTEQPKHKEFETKTF